MRTSIQLDCLRKGMLTLLQKFTDCLLPLIAPMLPLLMGDHPFKFYFIFLLLINNLKLFTCNLKTYCLVLHFLMLSKLNIGGVLY